MSDGVKRGVNREAAQQTFRQFAWHLASRIAEAKPATRPQRGRGAAGAKR